MSLGVDNILHENSGATTGVESTTTTVSLAAGDTTTAGSTLIAVLTNGGVSGSITPPTGWIKDADTGVANAPTVAVFRKPPDLVTTGESSWVFTDSGAVKWAWYVKEMTSLDPIDPMETSAFVYNSAFISTSTATRSSGTTSANPSLDTIQIAAFQSKTPAISNAPGSWAGYTNGFVEVTEVASTSTNGSFGQQGLAVARRFSSSTGTGPFETSATYTPIDGTSQDVAHGLIVVYRAASSPIVSPLTWQLGFDHGSPYGIASSTLFGIPITGTSTGTPGTDLLVQAASARGSAYGCRVISSNAIKYIGVGNGSGLPSTIKALVTGFDLRVVSGTGIVVVGEWQPVTGTILQLVYDVTNTKYGLRWGSGGTVAWQSGTTALNTFIWADVKISGITTATWHADWTLETGVNTYTPQSSPTDLTGQTPATSLSFFRVGGANVTQTVTTDVDNIVASVYGSTYPLGPHVLSVIKVDPAATPTVSGTVGNFALVTNNATGAALTSGTLTSARDALDELPVTVSATSDGVVQTTTAASDYLEFLMDTITLGSSQIIDGVRLLACLISTTGAGSGNLAIRGYDGTTETVLASIVAQTPGSSTTLSLTNPPWVTAMWNPTNGWTQSKINSAALRVGFSGDATPDMGVIAIYLEVAVGKTRTQLVAGGLASAEIDPTRLGVVSITLSPPSGYNTNLYYEKSGVPTTVPVTGGTTVTEQLNTSFAEDVNYIAVYPASEPDPVS